MLYILIILAVGICLYVSLAPKLPGMQEGVWEITMETTMPEARMPSTVTNTQLLNKEAPVPEIHLPGFECRMQRRRHPYHVIGNFVLCRIQCRGQSDNRGDIQGSGYIKYRGPALKGKLQMRTIGGQDQKRFNIGITGVYQGPA